MGMFKEFLEVNRYDSELIDFILNGKIDEIRNIKGNMITKKIYIYDYVFYKDEKCCTFALEICDPMYNSYNQIFLNYHLANKQNFPSSLSIDYFNYAGTSINTYMGYEGKELIEGLFEEVKGAKETIIKNKIKLLVNENINYKDILEHKIYFA